MSSGNLTADRRFDYARSLAAAGDHHAAADVMAQALELAPEWAEARFAYAEELAAAGARDDAKRAYQAYLARDPVDSMGAGVRLALLDAATPDALPEAYMRRLFDEYAPRFDTALVERLRYQAPEKLAAAIAAVAPQRHFAHALDLGCGTGLAGAALRDRVERLEGVDLSPAMVAAAQRKAIYDHLAVSEMVTFVGTAAQPFDLVIAADVLVYVGDLAPLFAAVARKITAGGLFAFTAQRHDDAGFVLGEEHRYRHSADYLRAIAAPFEIVTLTPDVFRQEKGIDVPGLLAILKR